MNAWQRLVASVALALAMGLALFPPWRISYQEGYSTPPPQGRFGTPIDALGRPIEGVPKYQSEHTRSWMFGKPKYPDRPNVKPGGARIIWKQVAIEQTLIWVPTVVLIVILHGVRVTITEVVTRAKA